MPKRVTMTKPLQRQRRRGRPAKMFGGGHWVIGGARDGFCDDGGLRL